MRYDIVDDIRRMNRKCYDKHGNMSRGEYICLDANSEARLAAYLIFELSINKQSALCCIDAPDIPDVLENGIRHLDMTVLGMKLRFDCESLCIEDDNGKVIT